MIRSIFSKCARHSSNIARYSMVRASFSSHTKGSEEIPVSANLDQAVKSTPTPTLDSLGRAYATGKRKTSIARVWVREGSGQIIVNGLNFIDYFQPIQREEILNAFVLSKTAGLVDVWCTVKGGGISGQSGAVKLGISRALEKFNPVLGPILRKNGLMTRDSRIVERKKPGQKKARKKFQWVKR